MRKDYDSLKACNSCLEGIFLLPPAPDFVRRRTADIADVALAYEHRCPLPLL